MSKNYSHIIKSRVRECLKDKGRTQKEMCHDLGFSESHFCRCINNGEIATSWIHAMAHYLDVSPEWLMNEDAVALTNFGYERGQLLNNKDDVLATLFHLCGYDPEIYRKMPEWMKSGLISDISPIISYYQNVVEGGTTYANRQQWMMDVGNLGLFFMDVKAGIGFRDENGKPVSEEEYYFQQSDTNIDIPAGRPTKQKRKAGTKDERTNKTDGSDGSG